MVQTPAGVAVGVPESGRVRRPSRTMVYASDSFSVSVHFTPGRRAVGSTDHGGGNANGGGADAGRAGRGGQRARGGPPRGVRGARPAVGRRRVACAV